MYTATIFLVKSIIISGLFFSYYWLFLRNKKLYVYNRFYLLASVVFSLLIPILHFEWYQVQIQKTARAFTVLQAISTGENEMIPTGVASTISTENILYTAYATLSLMLLISLVVRVAAIYRMKSRNDVVKINGCMIITTEDNKAPFSFFNNLFWKKNIPMDSAGGEKILKHEMVHITQHHTLDKMGMQLVLVVCWANPVYWLMQKELSLVHEFIADEKAIEGDDTVAFATMLLQSHYGNVFPDIIHPFFYSPIKRRLIMLTTSNKTSYSYLRRLLVLPLLGVSLLLFSFGLKKNTAINRSDKKIILVLDAGHGGKDNGTTGVNGTLEKDLNLKITQKISTLAKAYNIEVILTRRGDDYPTLDQRAQVVRNNAASLFVSIHVNGEDGVKNSNGYEIFVDSKCAQYDASRVLASAITAELQGMNIRPRLEEKGLFVLKNAHVPAVLIECGYINNPKEMAVLNNDTQLELLCRNILNGIVDYENSNK